MVGPIVDTGYEGMSIEYYFKTLELVVIVDNRAAY